MALQIGDRVGLNSYDGWPDYVRHRDEIAEIVERGRADGEYRIRWRDGSHSMASDHDGGQYAKLIPLKKEPMATRFNKGDTVLIETTACGLSDGKPVEVLVTLVTGGTEDDEYYYFMLPGTDRSCSGHTKYLTAIKPKGTLMGKLIDKAAFLALSSEDKTLVKQGFQDAKGNPTAEGLELLQRVTWDAHKKELASLAGDMEAYDKAEAKK